MRNLFILIALVISNYTIASKTDSLMREVNNLKLEVSNLKKGYDKKIKAYDKEFVYYKAKEDFYTSSINEQSGIYIEITTLMFAILGILSYGIYKYEINRLIKDTDEKINRLIKNTDEKIKKVNELAIKLDYKSTQTKAHLATIIADSHRKENNKDLAFIYYLKATNYHLKSISPASLEKHKNDMAERCKYTSRNIELAFEQIKEHKLHSAIIEMSKDILNEIIIDKKCDSIKNTINKIQKKLIID